MDIVASVELSEDGGRLIFRNRQTKSLMFAFDLEKKQDVRRLMSQMTVLLHHFETLAQKDTKTIDMFRPTPRRQDPLPTWVHTFDRVEPDEAMDKVAAFGRRKDE